MCVGAVMTGIIPARFEPLQVALKRNSSFFSLSTSTPLYYDIANTHSTDSATSCVCSFLHHDMFQCCLRTYICRLAEWCVCCCSVEALL